MERVEKGDIVRFAGGRSSLIDIVYLFNIPERYMRSASFVVVDKCSQVLGELYICRHRTDRNIIINFFEGEVRKVN